MTDEPTMPNLAANRWGAVTVLTATLVLLAVGGSAARIWTGVAFREASAARNLLDDSRRQLDDSRR